MKRRAPVFLLAWLLVAGLAAAQESPAPAIDPEEASVPDVPSGDARIAGRVRHALSEQVLGDVEVVLYALTPRGPGLRRSRSDARGDFAFEAIGNAPDTTYLVGARYAGVPFPGGRIRFVEGETERMVEIAVAEPSGDPSGLRIRESRLVADYSAGRPTLSEVHQLENPGPAPYYVPPDAREGATPGFVTSLPEGAGDLTAPMGVMPEGLVRVGNEVRFYGPVYAGPQDLAFSYLLPVGEGRLEFEKQFSSGTGQASLWIPQGGPPLSVPGVTPEPVEAEGRRQLKFDLGELGRGARVALALERPPSRADPGAVSVAQVRIIMEYDGAALLASETLTVSVAGEQNVVADGPEPLLRVPLPEGAELTGLTFDAGRFGLEPDGAGGIGVRGPLPPGENSIDLRYRLAAEGGDYALERSFDFDFPLLSVFVADTGLIAASPRLHRRRPVRSGDRTYIQLEGFEIEAGERVPITLTPLGARRDGLSPTLALAGVLLLTLASLAYLVRPLRRGPDAEDAAALESVAATERQAILWSIRDLDHDHETGKLSDEDHQALRDALRHRAAALLQRERAGAPPAAPPPAAAPHCSACGASLRADARFCSQCGAKLDEG